LISRDSSDNGSSPRHSDRSLVLGIVGVVPSSRRSLFIGLSTVKMLSIGSLITETLTIRIFDGPSPHIREIPVLIGGPPFGGSTIDRCLVLSIPSRRFMLTPAWLAGASITIRSSDLLMEAGDWLRFAAD
jgi:hypothetical protein